MHNIKVVIFFANLFLQLDIGISGDSCPSKESLSPCTCIQIPSNPGKGSLNMKSANLVEEATSTKAPPGKSEEASEKRRMEKRPRVQTSVTNMPEYNGTYYTIVTCKDVKTILELEQAITNGLHRKWIDKLIISNAPSTRESGLARLPLNWLKNLRVCQFEIRDSFMAWDFISENYPFEEQDESLLAFTATNCHLSGMLTYDKWGITNTKGLNLLDKLESLDLSKNHLIYIDYQAFKLPPLNLTSLNLSYNSIEMIESASFVNVAKLSHLDLSHNALTNIYRNMFVSQAKALKHLDLSWNHLRVLPADFFNGMPALKTVNLKSNFLSALPEEPWSTVWGNLSLIQLTGNFIDCDCEILWLLKMLPQANSTFTPARSTHPTLGQQIEGSCGFTQPEKYKLSKKLSKLAKEDINCAK